MGVFITIIVILSIALVVAFAIKRMVNLFGPKIKEEQLRGIFTKIGLIIALCVIIFTFESYTDRSPVVLSIPPGVIVEDTLGVIVEYEPEIPPPPEVIQEPPPSAQPETPIIVEVETDMEQGEIETPEETEEPKPAPVMPTTVTNPEPTMEPTAEPITVVDPPNNDPKLWVEQMPKYPGGMLALRKEVARKYRPPRKISRTPGVNTVIVRFVVERNGSLGDIVILKAIKDCDACSEEAIRVLKKLKHNFEPGIQAGSPVRVWFTLPITIEIR